ncbi:UNVERIFIED_ORG: hypothetical protein M2438_000081 [Methylobacterium sp. SuP10 SLI 274]|uniref:hypothetical protein n=1 Tax=Methylorubrum extorquens TaxID=408 RepID=UPI00209C9236|nr:hypothetical protein [Methylorubrum extorquens]MDF9861276.1 hypothetical protein [Methylorubrum pseudosasae]MDH6634906.1 hypothetical protein [Methylobacterium sp. SuP10 SLI 274]MDH6664076.1 hypothetical protein [Methylorubrum zatmanii]MCP1561082.1 hypothetical protein [Methylorubrum extorquens]MDF9789560.1 hypothetical protein [Methylorubrum extorquens]
MSANLRAVLHLAAGHAEELTTVVLDSRTWRSLPDRSARSACDGHKRTRGTKLHTAVNTQERVLTLHLKLADADDHAAGPFWQMPRRRRSATARMPLMSITAI